LCRVGWVKILPSKKGGVCGILAGDITTVGWVQIFPGPLLHTPGPLYVI